MTYDVGMRKSNFISGLKMGALFHREIVVPMMQSCFSKIQYASALIGPGSEVLGFDNEVSTDHDWRPRVFIFLKDHDKEIFGHEITKMVDERTPDIFYGFPTKPSKTDDLRSQTVFSVDEFWKRTLGFSSKFNPATIDWLIFSGHILLTLTSGLVYKDDFGELTEARKKFSYYPDDIWLYIMAAQWTKIAQEEAFMGRCGDVDDEIGSRLIAARLIKELMQLCFLMERRYAPYGKWFGTAFKNLDCANSLHPSMSAVLEQTNWISRQDCLSIVYELVANIFNEKRILDQPLHTSVSNYHTRPYKVINAGIFAAKLKEKIASFDVQNLPPNIGCINQFIDSTDVLVHPEKCAKLKSVYMENIG